MTVHHQIVIPADGVSARLESLLYPDQLYYRGLLYVLMGGGVLTCLDGMSGKEVCRHGLGGACNSSPIAANGRVYFANNGGTVFVVRAGKEFELLSTNSLGE